MWITDGGNNQTGWSNTRYDEIITRIAPATANRAQRYQLFQEAESILLDELPIIPIYIYTSISLAHPSVKGLTNNILNYTSYQSLSLTPETTVQETTH